MKHVALSSLEDYFVQKVPGWGDILQTTLGSGHDLYVRELDSKRDVAAQAAEFLF